MKLKPAMLIVIFVAASLPFPVRASAQDAGSVLPRPVLAKQTGEQTPMVGFNAYESFLGLADSSGTLLKLDSSVGYDFNRSLGVFAGVPLYFTSGSDSSASTPTVRRSGVGDAYLGAEYYVSSKLLRYSTTVTVGFPTGSVAKGFGAGQVTADWTNRFRRSFGALTPAFSAGIGNTTGVVVGAIPASEILNRSLTSTGIFAHLSEGAEYELTRRIYLGAAGYHILPFGSRVASDSAQPPPSTVHESGVDVWLGFEASSLVHPEIGYSRSVTFSLNSLSFRIGLDVGRMFRARRNRSVGGIDGHGSSRAITTDQAGNE